VSWAVALKLGRVSNLPTVWTNILAGVVIVGGATFDARVPWLVLAVSLCYLAGMFLNDAFDRGFDSVHRPERPIPSGEVTAATVFGAGFAMLGAGVGTLAWVGYGFADGTGWRPLVGGLVLAAAIVFYDWRHKQNPLSPVIMGICRMLVYVTAAYAFAADPPDLVFAMSLLLLCYLVGLTYIAKQEHLGRVANLWPLVFLALPLLWAMRASLDGAIVAGISLLFVAWVLYSLWFLRRRRPGDVPRAVGGLLAGICLWDALVITAAGRPSVAALALGLFGLTLLLQRFVSPT
jgi:4-hydroxybenzoate polyprenyltransferase